MITGSVCPVCEIPFHAEDGRAPEAPEKPVDSLLGRLWQSGRMALLCAVALLTLATVVPLLTVQRAHHIGSTVSKSPLALITADGEYGRELKSTTLIAVPGAAFFLLTFLWSRRTRPSAVAARPLVLAISLLPLMGAVMPVLKLGKHNRFEYSLGPAFALIALGTLMGILAATRFGRGLPEPRRSLHRDDNDDDTD